MAVKIGTYWAIPCSTVKPCDARIKSGKYEKKVVEMSRKTVCDEDI